MVCFLVPENGMIWYEQLSTHISQTFILPGYLEPIKNLFRGGTLSNCPMPCKTFRTKTKLISKRAAYPRGRVRLSFSEKVTILLSIFWESDNYVILMCVQISITITELETPSISELLSSIGGSIGLWLGLGAFQAIEILSRIFVALANKVRIMSSVQRLACDE